MNHDVPHTTTLISQLSQLRRRRRHLQGASVLLLGSILVAGVWICQSNAVETANDAGGGVEAQAFVAKTATGEVHCVFACREDGSPYLEMRDAHGKRRVLLALDNATGESKLVLSDANERGQLAQICQGEVCGMILREQGVGKETSNSLCMIADGSGKDSGRLTIYGKEKTPAFELKTQRGSGCWTLADQDGNPLATAP
jgi:hypothetical protein